MKVSQFPLATVKETPADAEIVSHQLMMRAGMIKKIAANWKDRNTKEIVDFTHSQIPYIFVDKGEIIPYELITQEDPKHIY